MNTTDIDQPLPALLYDDEQDALRRLVRDLLDDTAPWSSVVDRLDQVSAYDSELWVKLAEVGIVGLLIPEEFGGSGAGAGEMAVALEELGRAVASVPTLTSAVASTVALAALVEGDQPAAVATLLSDMAGGEVVVAPAVSASALHGNAWGHAFQYSTSGRVDGELDSVVGANGAHQLLVPAWQGDEPVLLLVEAGTSGVEVSTHPSLDMTRPTSTVALSDAKALKLAQGVLAEDALAWGLLWATALLASEELGNAEKTLEITCEYLRTRFQFGRALGSYQTLRHGAAELWTDHTGARAVGRYAAACLARNDEEAQLAAHLAQAVCSATAIDTVERCLQMMGGIGVTWEHPTHLHLKRAAADLRLFGTPERHRQEIGRLRGLPSA